MIAYKGMEPGMICRGYQLYMGRNTTPEANCQRNGFTAQQIQWTVCAIMGIFGIQNTIWFVQTAIWMRMQWIPESPAQNSGCSES